MTNWPTSWVLVTLVSKRSTFLSVMSVQNTERMTKSRKHKILRGVLFYYVVYVLENLQTTEVKTLLSAHHVKFHMH
jgi:hypothetical protein